jgi:rod shape-determining protein MreC
MESLFNRYRNITVLLVLIFAQLILLAWQIKSENDVPLVRVWAITAVTPVASAIENLRNGTTGFFGNYFALRDARQQSKQLRSEVDRLRIENQMLKNELESAQRAEALAGFQARTPSKMLGARVIGTTSSLGAKSVLIDRGSTSGVRKGMAVVTPAGIVGRVLTVYPFASQVLSVSDPGFAAGVESQKGHVHGVLKGTGNSVAKVDYVPTGQKVEQGEMFYTSGEDRVFPKGLPAGRVTSVKDGTTFQEVFVQPTGVEAAPEEVLVVVNPVHQDIPEAAATDSPLFLAPDVQPEPQPEPRSIAAPQDPKGAAGATGSTGIPLATPRARTGATQADKIMEQYRRIGEAQKFVYGEGGPGSTPPNFNIKVPAQGAQGAAGAPVEKPTGRTP